MYYAAVRFVYLRFKTRTTISIRLSKCDFISFLFITMQVKTSFGVPENLMCKLRNCPNRTGHILSGKTYFRSHRSSVVQHRQIGYENRFLRNIKLMLRLFFVMLLSYIAQLSSALLSSESQNPIVLIAVSAFQIMSPEMSF